MMNITGKDKALVRQCQTMGLLAFFVAIIVIGAGGSAAFAQSSNRPRQSQETNQQIQQQLQMQQRDQQMQFDMNQIRGQQMRQQQFQPMPPPSLGITPQQRGR